MAGIKELTTIQPEYTIKKLYLPSELPDAKTVTHIQGVPIDERLKEEEKEKARLYEVDPEDELNFLEKERTLLEARLDNQDLKSSKRPPERKKWWVLLATALAAIATILGYFLK